MPKFISNKEKIPLPIPGSCFLLDVGVDGPLPPYLRANFLASSRAPSMLGIPSPAPAFNLKLPKLSNPLNKDAETCKLRRFGSLTSVRRECVYREEGRQHIIFAFPLERLLLNLGDARLRAIVGKCSGNAMFYTISNKEFG